MKSIVMEVLDKNAMCLSGNGRKDSPGHSACYWGFTVLRVIAVSAMSVLGLTVLPFLCILMLAIP